MIKRMQVEPISTYRNGSGCRHAPISIMVGFTGNRSSHMRKLRRADVAHANRAGWTGLGETHV